MPSAVVLRCFVIAEGDSYRVLPGGLAREPAGDTALRQLGRLNGTLKDVWVLAEDAADVQIPTSRRFHQLAVDRGSADLQSRVADNLYWLGRYIERLDNDARLLRTTATRVAQGVIGGRESVELRMLGKLLDRANLMPLQAALAMPESAAFQQGLVAVASEKRGLATVLDNHPAPRRHAARPLLARHDRRRRPADERGAQPAAQCPRQPRSAARGARRHRPLRRHALGPRAGEHDARHRLAVPRSRPAHRARPVRAGLGARAVPAIADRLGRRDAPRARAVRQHHHLSHALSRPAPARAGARPGGARRQQPARLRLPDAHRSPAISSGWARPRAPGCRTS